MTDDDWATVLAANLDSAFYLLRASGPALRATGGGAVVLISSINGERGKVGQANYAASKAGLNRSRGPRRASWGRSAIRVNASRRAGSTPDDGGAAGRSCARARKRKARSAGWAGPTMSPARRCFCAADAARHVTGQVLRVDGGQLIRVGITCHLRFAICDL